MNKHIHFAPRAYTSTQTKSACGRVIRRIEKRTARGYRYTALDTECTMNIEQVTCTSCRKNLDWQGIEAYLAGLNVRGFERRMILRANSR
jgi:hypothetical protein